MLRRRPRASGRPARILLALGWLACGSGCCPRPKEPPRGGPAEAVQAYAARLLAGDLQGARELLDTQTREQAGTQALKSFLEQGGEGLRSVLEETARGGLTVVGYRVRLSDGSEVWVEPGPIGSSDSGFLLAGGGLAPSPQGSPAGALELFARALETSDCALLLRVVPPVDASRLGEARLLQGCRSRLEGSRELAPALRRAARELPAPAAGEGGRLRVALQPGLQAVLLRVEGRWYVEDLVQKVGTEGGQAP